MRTVASRCELLAQSVARMAPLCDAALRVPGALSGLSEFVSPRTAQLGCCSIAAIVVVVRSLANAGNSHRATYASVLLPLTNPAHEDAVAQAREEVLYRLLR